MFIVACNVLLVRDGICDDATNNEACEWDGGDCCDDNANTNTSNECYEGNLRQF